MRSQHCVKAILILIFIYLGSADEVSLFEKS